jgi:hypothetical protein
VVKASVLPRRAEGGPEAGAEDAELPRLCSLPRDCFVATVTDPYEDIVVCGECVLGV